MDSIDNKSTSGHGRISNTLLKHMKLELNKTLTLIDDTGIFPDLFKLAKIAPIYKKAEPQI